MQAMILAAGRGERMRPLTDLCPKPLLLAGGKPLIVHQIERLKHAGFDEVIINTAYLANQIHERLGDGKDFGLRIHYSDEGSQALETAGGLRYALRLVDSPTLLVINGDIYTDYDLERLLPQAGNPRPYLVLVPNPTHHPQGDFHLGRDNRLVNKMPPNPWTFSGIGCYPTALLAQIPKGPAPLAPYLRQWIDDPGIEAEVHTGLWMDIGTPQRLADLDRRLSG